MSYNGWANKETWLVNLWLGDELQSHKDEGEALSADYIRDLVDDLATELYGQSGLMNDLLTTAMSGINYWELEKHYMEEQ